MKNLIRIINIVVLIIVLSSCNVKTVGNNGGVTQTSTKTQINNIEDDKGNTKMPETESGLESISLEDFDIDLNGVIINDKELLHVTLDALDTSFGDEYSNLKIKASRRVENSEFTWYVLNINGKNNNKFSVEYIVDKVSDKGYVVSANLINARTSRGLRVGDDLEKMIDLYGKDVDPISYDTSPYYTYYYKLDKDSEETAPDKSICMIVDKNSGKVTDISVNYNMHRAMNEMNIPSFD